MSQFAAEGKVRYLGLSEATEDQIHRAFAFHPVAALSPSTPSGRASRNSRYSHSCQELGIAFVAFSSLGRGFFSGKLSRHSINPQDLRHQLPRFQPENFVLNSRRLLKLSSLAEEKGCSPAQLALAWILTGQGAFAIPGTKSLSHLEENFRCFVHPAFRFREARYR